MDETMHTVVVLGATVDEETADRFTEKCKPHSTTDIIEAFINSVIDGDIKMKVEVE